jgi:hypothetical protein
MFTEKKMSRHRITLHKVHAGGAISRLNRRANTAWIIFRQFSFVS